MFNLSSAEGTRFAEIVTEMSQRLRRLGPSPLRPDPQSVEEQTCRNDRPGRSGPGRSKT